MTTNAFEPEGTITISAKYPAFEAFPKIARLSRDMIITEKLDGTNACVYVGGNGVVMAGSRTRWLTLENDNFGFAHWVHEHEDELRIHLGIGHHHGEWWGAGIQRRYGLKEKRFSLFNTGIWKNTQEEVNDPLHEKIKPACCYVVPVLYVGAFDTTTIDEVMTKLKEHGSYAVPFMDPEGIVVYHTAARVCFKKTFDNDVTGKDA